MNRLQIKKIQASKRGVDVFRHDGEWGIYYQGAYLPDFLGLSKRETINLAYHWSIQKKIKLTVTFN